MPALLCLSATALSRAHPRAHARTTQHAHRARRDFWRNKHAHANTSPPKRPHPSLSNFPCPLPRTSPRISHTSASLRLSLHTFFPDQIPDQSGGASPTKSFRTAHLYGFPPVPVHHAPSNLGPRTVGSSGRRDGYASMVVLRTPSGECSWLGGLPQHVIA